MRKIVAFCLALCCLLTFAACDEIIGSAPGDSTGGAAGQLSETGAELYDEMNEKIQAYETEFVFTNVDEQEIVDAYFAIIKDHPEYFWMGAGYSYNKETSGENTTITFEPITAGTKSENRQKSEELQDMVDEIAEMAAEEEGLFDKVKVVHDYLIEETEYDQETYEIMMAGGDEKTIFDSSTAYGCLVENLAVCSGYANAFQMVMQKMGIECGRVTGEKIGGERHEWNYVCLDDEYYYIDVTWDDPVMTDTSGFAMDGISYEYFCITTDELEETHRIDRDQFVPDCTGSRYNYFRYNGYTLDSYDYDAAAQIIAEQLDEGKVEIKFSSPSELDDAVADLFEDQKIFSVEGLSGKVSYSVGASGKVLTIYVQS